jgi:hypothetical protein
MDIPSLGDDYNNITSCAKQQPTQSPTVILSRLASMDSWKHDHHIMPKAASLCRYIILVCSRMLMGTLLQSTVFDTVQTQPLLPSYPLADETQMSAHG